ncbi:MAG: MoaD/ThiS family protein [Halieaceae bacterium]|jgi:molybdopterin converting factor subunit 1|nr:MoaD/ThiS family protein [Halieaceae bacterium]
MKILLFAFLRETLGREAVELPDDAFPIRVDRLRALVGEAGDDAFRELMADANVLCAINQRVANDDATVNAGDEVAFFPPMTGG